MLHDDLLLLSSRSLGWSSESAFRRTRLGTIFGLPEGELMLERDENAPANAEDGDELEAAFPLDYVI